MKSFIQKSTVKQEEYLRRYRKRGDLMVIAVGVLCFILGELCGLLIVGLGTAAKARDNLVSEEREDDNGEDTDS